MAVPDICQQAPRFSAATAFKKKAVLQLHDMKGSQNVTCSGGKNKMKTRIPSNFFAKKNLSFFVEALKTDFFHSRNSRGDKVHKMYSYISAKC